MNFDGNEASNRQSSEFRFQESGVSAAVWDELCLRIAGLV